MFNVLKGWPTGLGGAYEESIEVTKTELAKITFEGAAVAIENGAYALAVASKLTLANQTAAPTAAKQDGVSLVFALDKYFTDGRFDVAYTGKVPVISGDFLAEFDTDVMTGTIVPGNFLTISATDGKIAAAAAAANVFIFGICLEKYTGTSGATVHKCRFFTPRYQTLA